MMHSNKTQKRVTALNRELPPQNEQFLIDFEQLQSQFTVSFEIKNILDPKSCLLYFADSDAIVLCVDFSDGLPGPGTIACCDGICSYFFGYSV